MAGTTVTTLFFEPSTRTRLSFELAAHRLGATVLDLTPTRRRLRRESLRDTILTLTAMGSDLLVIRHSLVDAAEMAAEWSGLPVINGGDGRREHPTQTLIDALTLRQRFGALDGLRMAIVGDIANSRVARGHLDAFPARSRDDPGRAPSFLPATTRGAWGQHRPRRRARRRRCGVSAPDPDRARRLGRDSGDRTSRRYGMNQERLSMMKPAAVVMHPGPINRGVEIDDAIADGERRSSWPRSPTGSRCAWP